MSFVASLVQSAAWPVAVFALVFLIRKPLQEAVSHRLLRLKAGPVEAEFDREAVEVREEVRRIPEVAAAKLGQVAGETVNLSYELATLIAVSPQGAVREAFAHVEMRLEELLEAADLAHPQRSGMALARVALDHDLISPETFKAIEGLSNLRNLVAHSVGDDIGRARAEDYVAMADAVLYAMRPKP
jgi:hypothetical protein